MHTPSRFQMYSTWVNFSTMPAAMSSSNIKFQCILHHHELMEAQWHINIEMNRVLLGSVDGLSPAWHKFITLPIPHLWTLDNKLKWSLNQNKIDYFNKPHLEMSYGKAACIDHTVSENGQKIPTKLNIFDTFSSNFDQFPRHIIAIWKSKRRYTLVVFHLTLTVPPVGGRGKQMEQWS